MRRRPWRPNQAAIVPIALLLFIAMFAASLWGRFLIAFVLQSAAPSLGGQRAGVWILTMVIFLLLLIWVGYGLTTYWSGVLIDGRGMMSLARLQLLLWTLILIPALLTAAVSNLVTNGADSSIPALAIVIPPQLLTVLGISAVSLAAAPTILSTKSAPNTAGDPNSLAMNMNDDDPSRADPSKARWSDLISGDVAGNEAFLDLGKIQLLFFTCILVAVYAGALYRAFDTPQPHFAAFPPFDSGMVALLGISHGGYLAAKAAPVSTPPSAG